MMRLLAEHPEISEIVPTSISHAGEEVMAVDRGLDMERLDLTGGKLVTIDEAAALERMSEHPLALAVVREAQVQHLRSELPAAEAVEALVRVLERRGHDHVVAKTWTTDGFYRETAGRVARRREEGCLVVEMEAAALIAVARRRGVVLGEVLYAGDDVSGDDWDRRERRPVDVRTALFEIAAEACLELEPGPIARDVSPS